MNLDVGSDLTDSDTTVVDKPSLPWLNYPQNKFRNWTADPVQRSEMFEKCSKNKSSTIYWMDVRDSEDVTKRFTVPDMGENDLGTTVVPIEDPQNKFWKMLEQKVSLMLKFVCLLNKMGFVAIRGDPSANVVCG